MSDAKKINSINKLLICLIILFIIFTVIYVFTNCRSINTIADSSNIIQNELINNEFTNGQSLNGEATNSEKSNEKLFNDEKENESLDFDKTNQGIIQEEQLDFYSEEVQNLFPITGAFPTVNLAFFAKLRNINRENIDNDTILKIAFSKVTKEDWSNSYLSETDKLYIDANLLNKYIMQIFGNINYNDNDFNNEDIKYDNNIAGVYNVNFNKEEGKYYIDIKTGDVDESCIEFLYPKVIKNSNKIEITIHPIYIRNCGEVQDEEGNSSFSYIVYKHYNFETNSFVSRITDTINDIWQYNEETEKEEYNKLIQGIQEKDLETFVFTYIFNEETNSYVFDSLTSK